MTKPPVKHHYIPAFYLSRWANDQDKVIEFSMPLQGKLVPKPISPEGTGFQPRLYELRGYEPELAMQVEQRFFQTVDNGASLALDQLERRGHYGEWSTDRRSAWSRFLLSLLLRCPEDVEAFREWWHVDFLNTDEAMEERYAAQRLPEDAVTFGAYLAQQPLAEVERHQFDIFVSLIDHERVGGDINGMHWRVLEAPPQAPDYLTSDRPIIRTENITGEDGHIAIPIGPRLLFIASPHSDFLDRVLQADAVGLVKEVNRQVVEGAARFVWGSDDTQSRFIMNRFGRNPQPRLMENILARRRNALEQAS